MIYCLEYNFNYYHGFPQYTMDLYISCYDDYLGRLEQHTGMFLYGMKETIVIKYSKTQSDDFYALSRLVEIPE